LGSDSLSQEQQEIIDGTCTLENIELPFESRREDKREKKKKNVSLSLSLSLSLSPISLSTSVSDWKPEPLLPEVTEQQKLDSRIPLIESAHGARVVLEGNKECVNLAALNPFGLLGEPEIDQAATEALQKYGCGSCGPRGFYGTIDVHLKLEKDLADFMRCEQTILYSSGFATVASAIPTFAKKGDLIFCDRGVNQAVQTGVSLSRADVIYFAHNDMADLSKQLEAVAADPKRAKKRKFVVVEGLYANYGTVLPFDKLMPLKHKHCFYLIVDESYSLGWLGAHGGGILELFDGKPGGEDIDIITGHLGNIACSVGGFCSGNNSVVTHQRLNGSGYVFSASLPPYLSCVSSAALKRIRTDDARRRAMVRYAEIATELLSAKDSPFVLRSSPQSPLIHIELRKDNTDARLQQLVENCIDRGVLLTRAKYVEAELFRPPPSIRLCVPASLTEAEVRKAINAVVDCARKLA
jgi:serine palmitoyltransferase